MKSRILVDSRHLPQTASVFDHTTADVVSLIGAFFNWICWLLFGFQN